MNEISEWLQTFTEPKSWTPRYGAEDADIREHMVKAGEYAMSTPEGEEFGRRGGSVERAMTIFNERFADRTPDNLMIVEALEEVIHDLLIELPSIEAPKPKPKAKVTPPAPVKDIPTVSAEASQFAYMWQHTVNTLGIAAVKPKAGQVTLHQNGKQYFYSSSEADRLLEEAIAFGLV